MRGTSLDTGHRSKELGVMGFLLWLLAVILVIAGIVQLFQGQIILGVVLIVVGFAVGPGGWSLLTPRSSPVGPRRNRRPVPASAPGACASTGPRDALSPSEPGHLGFERPDF